MRNSIKINKAIKYGQKIHPELKKLLEDNGVKFKEK